MSPYSRVLAARNLLMPEAAVLSKAIHLFRFANQTVFSTRMNVPNTA